MNRVLLLLIAAFIMACGTATDNDATGGSEYSSSLNSIKLNYLDGSPYTFDLNVSNATAFLFLAPDCPLCINYTLTIKQLRAKFSTDSISIVGVFPGDYYTFEEIDSFVQGYELDIPMILDPNLTLTNNFKATVTPEAVVLNRKEEIVYQGAVDNWMYSIGRKRTLITEHYLFDNFHALTKEVDLPWQSNKAVGCLIEL